jgi:hypothetical protein
MTAEMSTPLQLSSRAHQGAAIPWRTKTGASGLLRRRLAMTHALSAQREQLDELRNVAHLLEILDHLASLFRAR